MVNRLKKYQPIQKFIAQFDQLPKRDQQALSVLLVAVTLALIYFLLWRPVAGFHERAEADLNSATELLGWMHENQPAMQRLAVAHQGPDTVSSISDSRALMSVVTRSASDFGLSLNRFEPSGETAMRVWLEDVRFKQVAAWLEQLGAEHGVMVDQAAFDRRDAPGLVSARLTLEI